MSKLKFTLLAVGDSQVVTVYPGGGRDPLIVDSTQPQFHPVVEVCLSDLAQQDADAAFEAVQDQLQVSKSIAKKFQRLSDRVTVKDGSVFLDGDQVSGSAEQQILDFVAEGRDFAPLVNFYEKALSNPLGAVIKDSLFRWIDGQKSDGSKVTITQDGDVIGYKSVKRQAPEWRTDATEVYVPSRRGEGIVNGRDVSASEFIEQVPGDVVEMPRSKVLNQPSALCGDGLHIGTWNYAKGFMGGATVMLVRFNPRDVVSVPDGNSSWKLRVCRYQVLGVTDKPYEASLLVEKAQKDELVFEDTPTPEKAPQASEAVRKGNLPEFEAVKGTLDGESGTFTRYTDNSVLFSGDGENGKSRPFNNPSAARKAGGKVHGQGGPTSQAAKGRGRNAAQDSTGRFSAGRPGSKRDASTGRFA